MKYIETHSTDPAYNLAFEQVILEQHMSGEFLMLWQNSNTIVIGRNQNAAEEIDRAYVTEHGISVVRRMTGGGAVYHDLGNLNYSFITDYGAPGEHSISRFTEPVCRALEKMGVHAETSGRNDILVNGKKVSGIAERVYKNRILHHGCILFHADTSVLSAALHPDPAKFVSKSVKSVSSRVGNISDFLPEPMTVLEFRNRLRDELTRGDCAVYEPDEEERSRIRTLAAEKYRSPEWTWGHSPAFSYSNAGRFPGGSIKLMLNVEHGVITSAAFSGDYMALTDCDDAVASLRGCHCSAGEIRGRLLALDMKRMFGEITAENILELMKDLL